MLRSTRDNLVRLVVLAVTLTSCGGTSSDSRSGELPKAPPAPASLPNGLLLALSPFKVAATGVVTAEPEAARVEILLREDNVWRVTSLVDPESNVFHKAMVYDRGADGPALVTLGGSQAAVKLWQRRPTGFASTTIWRRDFGGKFSRMRDGEIVELAGSGVRCLAVATHDQGVVAVICPEEGGGYTVRELDHQPDTFVHEIEIGDLDGDGLLEIYATPSEPNRMDGTPQAGKVVRYLPARSGEREIVVDLGSRHAKEILVDDVDGDGRDELYIAVEGEVRGTGAAAHLVHEVEIRRYDHGAASAIVVGRINDHLCRFLTAGDVDGDGKRELVAAAFKQGLWLLRPGSDARAAWEVSAIDRDSSGFEHAALLADLDGDGTDELYVASDDDGEVRRYVWRGDGFARETIYRREVPGAVFTWNIMPVPVGLVR